MNVTRWKPQLYSCREEELQGQRNIPFGSESVGRSVHVGPHQLLWYIYSTHFCCGPIIMIILVHFFWLVVALCPSPFFVGRCSLSSIMWVHFFVGRSVLNVNFGPFCWSSSSFGILILVRFSFPWSVLIYMYDLPICKWPRWFWSMILVTFSRSMIWVPFLLIVVDLSLFFDCLQTDKEWSFFGGHKVCIN